jgi:glutaredoxin-like protein
MSIIEEKDRERIQQRLEQLKNQVRLVFFTQEFECEYCKLTREMLKTLSALSPKIKVETFKFLKDSETAKAYGVEYTPTIIVLDGNDQGIRFVGAPGGYEFIAFLLAIDIVGNQTTGLSEYSIKQLQAVQSPTRIQIFVTPSCPYCPSIVSTAHNIARANKLITAEMIEMMEFPFLIQKYNIQGVPHILINETHSFEGNLPEGLFVEQILNASGVAAV